MQIKLLVRGLTCKAGLSKAELHRVQYPCTTSAASFVAVSFSVSTEWAIGG